jgi:hypothetical protein
MTRGLPWTASLLLLLVDCAPRGVRTPSTEGKAPEALALLRVPVHHDRLTGNWSPAHLRALIIDGVAYELDRETTDFWLSPGEHRIHAKYVQCVHGLKSWYAIAIEDSSINSFGQPPFKAEAGRSYELGCAVSWNSGPWVTLTFDEVP